MGALSLTLGILGMLFGDGIMLAVILGSSSHPAASILVVPTIILLITIGSLVAGIYGKVHKSGCATGGIVCSSIALCVQAFFYLAIIGEVIG